MHTAFFTLAEGGAAAHVTTQATWLDWVVMVIALPAIVIAYQIWVTRGYPQPGTKQALLQAVPPLVLAIVTLGFVWIRHGGPAAGEFFSGFVVELTLSFDNVFAWFLVVAAFVMWRGYHARLVVWGVLIAIVLRVVVLTVGQGIVTSFWPVSIALFALLVKLGWGFAVSIFDSEDEDINPRETAVYRLVTKLMPVARSRYGTSLFTKQEGYREIKLFGRVVWRRGKITVFGLAVACLGGLDLLFAFDSIPAILAIARDPFIILSSNILAVLFLQSLYFLYEAVEKHLTRIKWVLPVIMWFVAVKILLGSPLFDWLQEHSRDLLWVILALMVTLLVTAIFRRRFSLKTRYVIVASYLVVWAFCYGIRYDWWHVHSLEISPLLSILVIVGLLVAGVVWSLVQPEVDKAEVANTEAKSIAA